MVLGECRQSLLMYAEPTPIVYHFNDTKLLKIFETTKYFGHFFIYFFTSFRLLQRALTAYVPAAPSEAIGTDVRYVAEAPYEGSGRRLWCFRTAQMVGRDRDFR